MSNVNPKNQAKVIQAKMKELGYSDFKLGHAQELVAALSGDKSWNVLSSRIKKYPEAVNLTSKVLREGTKKYTVRIESSLLCKMYLEVDSVSMGEAYTKVKGILENEELVSELVSNNIDNWQPIYDQDGKIVVTEISGNGEFSGHCEEGLNVIRFKV